MALNQIPAELSSIISTMDVPSFKRNDVIWLAKNLPVRNSKHPEFKKAMLILKNIAKDMIKKSDFDRIFN